MLLFQAWPLAALVASSTLASQIDHVHPVGSYNGIPFCPSPSPWRDDSHDSPALDVLQAISLGNTTYEVPSTSTFTPPSDVPRLWEIRPSSGKGLGVFATRPILRGGRIMIERPQFVIAPPERDPDGRGYRLSELLARVAAGFRGLDAAQQREYLACHEHRFPWEHGQEGTGDERLLYVFRSNAYATAAGRWGMFPTMARINHSCRPNAGAVWVSDAGHGGAEEEGEAGHKVVWATRDIAPGEEIFVSYVGLLQDAAARQRRLHQYGFRCSCPACQEEEEDRDREVLVSERIGGERRIRAGALLEELEEAVAQEEGISSDSRGAKEGHNATATAHSDLIKTHELLRLLAAEGIRDYSARAYRLAALFALRADRITEARQWTAAELELHRFVADDRSIRKVQEFLERLPPEKGSIP